MQPWRKCRRGSCLTRPGQGLARISRKSLPKQPTRQFDFDVAGLALFAAGNFIYIAASDLVPEIKRELRPSLATLHMSCLLVGLGLMYALAIVSHHHH